MYSSDHMQANELAHSLNEELTIILNTAVLAAGTIGPGHPANDTLAELHRSAMRCTELARGFTQQVTAMLKSDCGYLALNPPVTKLPRP